MLETYHKRNHNKLLTIIKRYAEVPKHLIADLKSNRVMVQRLSANPTNMVQRIDRLVDFIAKL